MTHIQSQLLVYEHDVSHLASFAVDYLWEEWQNHWFIKLYDRELTEVLSALPGVFSIGINWDAVKLE